MGRLISLTILAMLTACSTGCSRDRGVEDSSFGNRNLYNSSDPYERSRNERIDDNDSLMENEKKFLKRIAGWFD
jgi:hypothetical protein